VDTRVAFVIKQAEESGGNPAVSLRSLARQIGISATHLSKLFKEETGKVFRTYLREARLNRATNLLRRSDLSVKQVAAMTGYKSTSGFDRDFRETYGVSPGIYRADAAKLSNLD
jgi:transcriptional regulator GlxA family with amidase domain